jgi:hypothetical protein
MREPALGHNSEHEQHIARSVLLTIAMMEAGWLTG